MFLGLAYHATTAWLPGVGPWYFIADPSPVEALVPFSSLVHAFRMQLFFALSGFFSHLVFERRGEAHFLSDRRRRLLEPLVVAIPLMLMLDVVLRRCSSALGLLPAAFELGTQLRFWPLHLWFLIYLFVLCLIAWAMPEWKQPVALLRKLLRWPTVVLLMMLVPTLTGLWFHPDNRPDTTYWPKPFELLHFGLFFTFGWAAWAARDGLRPLQKQAPLFLTAGLATGLVLFNSPLQWQREGQLLGGLVGWLITLGAFGLALRVSPQRRPRLRFLVDASYWVYLVHYPLLMALQVAFGLLDWPGLLEYSATTLLTLTISLLTFPILVRRTSLANWLSPRRREAGASRLKDSRAALDSQ